MPQDNAATRPAGQPLIESDRVEGTNVYSPDETKIGSIKRLMIEKMSARLPMPLCRLGVS